MKLIKRAVPSFLVLIPLFLFSMETNNDFWSWDPAMRDSIFEPLYTESLKHLEQFALESEHIKTVVVLNAKTGMVANFLAESFSEKQIVGIETNLILNFFAQNKYDRPNLHSILTTPAAFSLKENKLPNANFIACYNLLHSIDRAKLPAIFKNIADNMEKGALLDLTTAAKHEISPSKLKRGGSLFVTLWERISNKNAITLLTPEELQTLAKNAGLSIHRCEQIDASDQADSDQAQTGIDPRYKILHLIALKPDPEKK